MGRVALDAESSATGAKLNEASVVLESSRSAGSGVRMPLKFDPDLKLRGVAKGSGGVGLFPGAMIAARGRNGGGGWFVVSEILSVGLAIMLTLSYH
jgi:DNA polymerase alpha subunit B